MQDQVVFFYTNGKPGYRFFTAKLRKKSGQGERRLYEKQRKKQTSSKK